MIYRRKSRDFDAVLFDGSSASAAEISRTFGDVSHDGGRVEVGTAFGSIFAGMGCWVVRDRRTTALSVIDDREFSQTFEPIEAGEASAVVLVHPHDPHRDDRRFDVI